MENQSSPSVVVGFLRVVGLLFAWTCWILFSGLLIRLGVHEVIGISLGLGGFVAIYIIYMRICLPDYRKRKQLRANREKELRDSKSSQFNWLLWAFIGPPLLSVLLLSMGVIDKPLQTPWNRNHIPRPLEPGAPLNQKQLNALQELQSKIRDAQQNPISKQTDSLVQESIDERVAASSKKTAQYWRQAIAKFYQRRFDDPPTGKSKFETMAKTVGELRLAAASIEGVETQDVDPQLLDLATRQIQNDIANVRTFTELVAAISSKSDSALDQKLTQQEIADGSAILNDLLMSPEKVGEIEDEQRQALVARLLDVIADNEQMFFETAILQARLEERYPNELFDLPKLENFLTANPQYRVDDASNRSRTKRRMALEPDPRKTAAYWDSMVSAIHEARFGELASGREYSLSRKFVEDYRPAIHGFQPTGVDHVDPDLVVLVDGHLQKDIELIELWKSGAKLAKERGINVSYATPDAQVRWMDVFLKQIGDDQLANQLNAAESQFAIRWIELIENRSDVLFEIEVMQARMQERYKGQNFDLPKIE